MNRITRDEFLDLLRTDGAFRDEVRRQLLTEELLTLPDKLDYLAKLVNETIVVVRDLAEAQRRAEERLSRVEERLAGVEEQAGRLEASVAALAEAQRRAEERLAGVEERVGRLEASMAALAEAQRATEERMGRVEEQLAALAERQEQMTKEMQWFANWQRGEDGRRKGERYEQATISRATALFNGGQGGTPVQPWVQQQLFKWLQVRLADGLISPEDDPFLADLIWWKGDQAAVVEISLQVNGYDVFRAARRAETLRRVGVQTLAIVIGDQWAVEDSRDQADTERVEWKVGADLSDGFLSFRHLPSE